MISYFFLLSNYLQQLIHSCLLVKDTLMINFCQSWGRGGLNKDVYWLLRNGYSNIKIALALLTHKINHVKLKKTHDFTIGGDISQSERGRHLSQTSVVIFQVINVLIYPRQTFSKEQCLSHHSHHHSEVKSTAILSLHRCTL